VGAVGGGVGAVGVGWGGDVPHNHDRDREACLNRQILNNSVERKTVEDLCERQLRLTHKELQIQNMDTLTYEDARNISWNMHIARSSQLLSLQTDIEETHEVLIAVLLSIILVINQLNLLAPELFFNFSTLCI